MGPRSAPGKQVREPITQRQRPNDPEQPSGSQAPPALPLEGSSVDAFIRSFNPSWVKRRLRHCLVGIRDEVGLVEPVPHSADQTALLAYARRVHRSLSPLSPQHLALSEHLGIVLSVCGSREEAHEVIDSAIDLVDTNALRGRLLYLLGHYVHVPDNDLAGARRTLLRAARLMEDHHEDRARAYLVLGRVARHEGEHGLAEDALERVLNARAHAYRPIAHQYLGLLRHQQGLLEEAIQQNRRAFSLLGPEDRLARIMVEIDYAMFQMEQGAHRKALTILSQVLEEQVRWLDIRGAGNTYNNVAVAWQRLGERESARAAFIDALQFQLAAGNLEHVATVYRNLAGVLQSEGETPAALAALARAERSSGAAGSVEGRFRAELQRLDLLIAARAPRSRLRATIDACETRIRERRGLPSDLLARFGALLAELYRRTDAESGGEDAGNDRVDPDERQLEQFLGPHNIPSFAEQLADRLGSIPWVRGAPGRDAVQGYLLLHCGDFFRTRDFAREFSLGGTAARNQVRALQRAGIIESIGANKGARYGLAFHRANTSPASG
ncbi:MAG: hypothetical protein IT349_21080 [Candidatus Eisenbacteria bacterium]|nr:hypothetical protein [Candidatus Eisenbacteria bacterium]